MSACSRPLWGRASREFSIFSATAGRSILPPCAPVPSMHTGGGAAALVPPVPPSPAACGGGASPLHPAVTTAATSTAHLKRLLFIIKGPFHFPLIARHEVDPN